MALTPEEQEELNRLLAEGIELARKLGDEAQAISLSQYTGDLNTAKRAVESLRREWKEYTSDIEGARLGFSRIVDEIKNMNTGTGKATNAFRGMQSIAAKLQYHQEGISKLSKKELEQLKSKFEQKQKDLDIARQLIADEITGLKQKRRNGEDVTAQLTQTRAKYDEINNELNSANSFSAQFTEQIKEQIKEQKKLEKQLGALGEILKGISKIPIIGGLVDSQDALDEMEKTFKKTGSSLKAFGSGIGNIGSQIKSGLLNPANLASIAITELIVALKKTDEEAGNLAKTMNMTYSEALNTRRELGNIAAVSGDVALTTKGLQESYVAIGKSLGSNAMASEETLITMTKLREQAGYTNEQLVELNKLSLVNGKSLEDNTKEILGGAEAYASQRGLVLNEKDILNDVVKASASLKLSLGGSTDALAKAAVQARAVGIDLETAARMADQLLQFESSIENELSAELLTGKDLNFERARQLALNNDIAGAAEEIANQVGSSADFAEMNAIQQEAIAKAAGMTKDQLAQSLMDREALAKIGMKDAVAAKAKYDTLRKTMTAEQAAAALGDEQLAKQYEQQSVQERFNQAVEKLREIFVQIAEPILAIVSPLMNLVSTILPAINILLQPIVGIFKVIGDTITGFTNLITGNLQSGLGGFLQIMQSIAVVWAGIVLSSKMLGTNTLKNITLQGIFGNLLKGSFWKGLATAITSIFTGQSILGPFGIPVAIAAAAGLTSLAVGTFKKGEDVLSPGTGGAGSYGQRMLFDRGEIIALNDSDNVIATTNPIKPVTKANDIASMSIKSSTINPPSKENKTTPSTIVVSNSTAPKKEPMMDPNASTNARLDALIAITGKVNTIPTLRIQ